MSAPKFSPGPWKVERRDGIVTSQAESKVSIADFPWKIVMPAAPFALGMTGALVESEANARLTAAAPLLYGEASRYLTILERAEADPELWARLTEGTGIATLNAYRAALAKAVKP